jgi:1,4-dihydroxy-2-naphthoyl-CoA synthase
LFLLIARLSLQYPVLAADDMVKIDLGAHIDGYIVLSAHTLIVGVDLSTPEAAQAVQSGRRAAVINAAYTAAEVAAKLIKNGACNIFFITWLLFAHSPTLHVHLIRSSCTGCCVYACCAMQRVK